MQQSICKCRLLKWGNFAQGGMSLEIYVFRLTHPIDIILSPLPLCRHYMEMWGIHVSTANSNHKGLVTQALISSFMATKQTFKLPVMWEVGVLVTSLWLRNRCWLIIHWILWPLLSKPQQCYFHNFGYNVTNITHFPRHMKIKVTTFPSGISKHKGLIAK